MENESDSNPLNSIQQKLNSENLSKIEHVPTNRNELFEIKRGTIAAYNKKYFPYKRKY